MKPTKEQILEKFNFEGDRLVRKDTGSCGSLTKEGYVLQRICGRPYGVHRLIYFLASGEWPDQVDHINGNRSDNRPENLRAASHAQNCMNRSVKAVSGRKGCYWNAKRNKWMVQVSVDGKRKTIGYFDNLDDASEAFKISAKKNYGEFARTV